MESIMLSSVIDTNLHCRDVSVTENELFSVQNEPKTDLCLRVIGNFSLMLNGFGKIKTLQKFIKCTVKCFLRKGIL